MHSCNRVKWNVSVASVRNICIPRSLQTDFSDKRSLRGSEWGSNDFSYNYILTKRILQKPMCILIGGFSADRLPLVTSFVILLIFTVVDQHQVYTLKYAKQLLFFIFYTHHVSQGPLLVRTFTLEDFSPLIWVPLFKQLVRAACRLNPSGDCSHHNLSWWGLLVVVNVTCPSSDIQQGCFGLEVLCNFLLERKNQKMVTDAGMVIPPNTTNINHPTIHM